MSKAIALNLGAWFTENEPQVRKNLDSYFGGNPDGLFTGRHFEHYSAMGNPNRFEPSDVLAIEALSVSIRPESAAQLLLEKSAWFSELLPKIPDGVEMWEVPRSTFEPGSAADKLHGRLQTLDRVKWVKAGKLMASKRPRLVPVFDKFVKSVLKPPKKQFWVFMYDQLADPARRKKIVDVCSNAPDNVSLLRRIDVAVWMHAWVPLHE